MKKMIEALFRVIIGTLVVCGMFVLFSHLYYHRSVMATVGEIYLMSEKNDTTEEEYYAELIRRKGTEEPEYEYNENLKSSVEEEVFNSMQVYYLNKNASSPIIIYLHGGAYIGQINPRQWNMLDNIVQEADCEAIVPIYPFAPWHTYEESYKLLTQLYQEIIEQNSNRKIILMGDSAGGGLALGLAESFGLENIPQPDELILLSPWVEATETNPDIPVYEKVDPVLNSQSLRAAAAAWAGDTSCSDYHISPINGELSVLQKVTIFIGTREMFYPDCVLLKEKLEDANVSVDFRVAEGLNHAYPSMPIPEAKKAQMEIAEIISQ